MAFTCCKCGYVGARGTITIGDDGSTAEYCKLHVPFADPDKSSNPLEGFTVQHVHDENNQKIKVNSLKELRAAEKRYGFALAMMSDNNAAKSDAPANASWAGNVSAGYDWKWAKDPSKRKDMEGVSAGSMSKEKAVAAGRR